MFFTSENTQKNVSVHFKEGLILLLFEKKMNLPEKTYFLLKFRTVPTFH